MCAGAIVHAHPENLVYGAEDPKAGAVHSAMHVLSHPALSHQVEVRGGVLAGRVRGDCRRVFALAEQGKPGTVINSRDLPC